MPLYRRTLLAVGLCFLAVPSSHAAEWLKLKSAHFDLYTSQPKPVATLAIHQLEDIHAAFVKLGEAKEIGAQPLSVILFSGYNEFGYYNLGHFVKAYFTNVSTDQFRGDLMVVSDFNRDANFVLIHEFAHYCSRESGGRLPLWLEEGLASYYESLEMEGNQATLGKPVTRHLKLLKSKRFVPMPFGDLFSQSHEERWQHNWDESAALYAQGWAVVHTLATNPRFASKFPQFLSKMRSGMAIHNVLSDVYGTTIAQLRGDVDEHIDMLGKNEAKIVLAPTADPAQPEEIPLKPWEARLLLTNLLVFIGKPMEAERDFEALRNDFSKVPEVYEALGDFKYARGEKAIALRHYRSAVKLGSRNPITLLRVVESDGGSAELKDQAFGLLGETLRKHPGNVGMRIKAMDWAFTHKRFDKAAEWAGRFAESGDFRDFEFNYTAAYAHYRADDYPEAGQWIKRALASTDDTAEKQRASHLLESIERGLQRRQAAARVADKVGLESGFAEAGSATGGASSATPRVRSNAADMPVAEVDLARNIDRSNDTAIDTERLDQTLTVFTRDRGGKVADGTIQELRCLGSTAQLVIVSSGKRMAFEIDNPSNILITRAGQHVANYDFRCGRQPAAKVHIGYEPSEKNGRAGFLRILQFD